MGVIDATVNWKQNTDELSAAAFRSANVLKRRKDEHEGQRAVGGGERGGDGEEQLHGTEGQMRGGGKVVRGQGRGLVSSVVFHALWVCFATGSKARLSTPFYLRGLRLVYTPRLGRRETSMRGLD